MRWIILNAFLLFACIAATVGVQLADRSDPLIRASVRRYAQAIQSQDESAALAEIAPDQQPVWADWIHGQLGNIYEVKAVSVRSPSILQQFTAHVTRDSFEASVALDVNRGYPDYFYQPTTRVGVVIVDGHWYLTEPLLSREAGN